MSLPWFGVVAHVPEPDACEDVRMRLESEDGTPRPQALWAVLTRDEARFLMQALQYYFTESEGDPAWHHHVGEGDTGLTVAIE